MKIGLVLVMILLPFVSFTQTKENWKAGFHSIAAGGFATGQTATKALGQYSAGVGYNRFFTGIGVGYDAYRFNTIPIFVDWRAGLGKKRIFFVYAQVGYGIPGNYEDSTDHYWANKLRGSLYTDGGIGVRARIGRANAFILSAGISTKKVVEVKTFIPPCSIATCPYYYENNSSSYKYSFSRLILKAGWEFGKSLRH